MNEVKFSIVVPVYNVEQYVVECINSVLRQSLGCYELILVDDGSTDRSGYICDEYAEIHPQIYVIHKKNGGLSSARNEGLKIAQGEYVIFLDSDDFWDDDNALLNVSCKLSETKADVLVFSAKRFFSKDRSFSEIVNVPVNRDCIIKGNENDVKRYLIKHNFYRAAAWNKVVKNELLKDNNLYFREGYLSEDMDWCGDLLLLAKTFDYYDSSVYCYRQQRKGSITQSKTEKLISDKLFMIEKGYDKAKLLDEENKKILASYYAYEYAVTLGVSAGVDNTDLIARMEVLQEILNNDISNKVRKVNKLKSILGYKLTRLALILFVYFK